MWNAVAKSRWQHCDKHCEKFSTCKFYFCCIAFCTCIAKLFWYGIFALTTGSKAENRLYSFSHWAKRQIESKLSTQMLNAFDVKSFFSCFSLLFNVSFGFDFRLCHACCQKNNTFKTMCLLKKKLVWKMRTIFLKNHLKWRKFPMKKKCVGQAVIVLIAKDHRDTALLVLAADICMSIALSLFLVLATTSNNLESAFFLFKLKISIFNELKFVSNPIHF